MRAQRLSAGLAAASIVLLACAAALAAHGVRPFIKGSWGEIHKEHVGKPTIVHLWGLTCAPCRAEMPEWGKLLREKPSADLVVIHAERAPPKPQMLNDALTRAGLQDAENWMFSDGFLERLRFEIDPKWHGELPATVLIARDATTRMIVGPADLDAIRNWIRTQGRTANE